MPHCHQLNSGKTVIVNTKARFGKMQSAFFHYFHLNTLLSFIYLALLQISSVFYIIKNASKLLSMEMPLFVMYITHMKK